jgi:hypothetical protein
MTTGPTPRSPWAALELAGDEAILPAGVRLADEHHRGRQCFVLIEGAATVEAAGRRIGGSASWPREHSWARPMNGGSRYHPTASRSGWLRAPAYSSSTPGGWRR